MIDKKLVPEDLLQAPTRHCAGAIRFRIASATEMQLRRIIEIL